MKFFSSFPPPTAPFEGKLRRESSQIKQPPCSGATSMLCPLRGLFFYCWIPACAGMTAREVAA